MLTIAIAALLLLLLGFFAARYLASRDFEDGMLRLLLVFMLATIVSYGISAGAERLGGGFHGMTARAGGETSRMVAVSNRFHPVRTAADRARPRP